MTRPESSPIEASLDDGAEPEQSVLATAPLAQAGLGLVAVAFGVIAWIDASDLDIFGSKGIPGPGFFPVFLAVAVIALGALQVVVSVVRGLRSGLGNAGQMHGLTDELLRAAYVWLGFLVSIVLMPLVGFVPASILLIAYLVFAVERIKGIKAVLVIVAVPLVAYALFVFVLGVELPASSLFESS